MTIAITKPVSAASSTSNATSYATGAFTPTANSLLLCCVVATDTAATGSVSGGGLTWSPITSQVYNTTDKVYAFSAPVGASPSSTTVTFDCTDGTASGAMVLVLEVTGTGTPTVRQSKTVATTGTNPQVTFDSNLNTNNGYVFFAGTPGANPFNCTARTGYTLTVDTGWSSPTAGVVATFKATGETVATCGVNKGVSVVYGGIGIEVQESPAPAPTVTSSTPSSGSIAGGTSITNLAGTNFVSGATVTFGGVAATSVIVSSSTQITCTTARKTGTPGLVNVVVTNPDAQSGTLTNGYTYTGQRIRSGYRKATIDPATLSLNGWWRANSTTGYDNAGTWLGVASAGSSGSRNLTSATFPDGFTLNGHRCPDFVTANDDNLVNATAISSYLSASQWWSAVVFKIDAFTTNDAVSYNNAALLNDTGGFWGWYVKGSGSSGTLVAYQWDGADKHADFAISTGAWYCAVAWYDGTNINLSVNGSVATTAAAGNVQVVTGSLICGRNYQAPLDATVDGAIADLAISASAYTSSEARKYLNYARARYGLTLT